MATRITVNSRVPNRKALASFLKSPEQIRAFEALIDDVSGSIPDSIAQAELASESAMQAAENASNAAALAMEAANAAQNNAQAASSAVIIALVARISRIEKRLKDIEDAP